MKKLFLTCAMAAFAVSAFSQGIEPYDRSLGTYERVTQRGPYLTNRFFDNMYISVAGGVNLYLGSGDSRGDFGKRLAPALDVSLGKWVTPSVGLRLQYSGLQGRGWSTVMTPYTNTTPDGEGLYKKMFNMMHIHGDVMWNISNAIGGYKETRTWDFIPYLGAGVVRTGKHGSHNTQLAATVGLVNKIRLGDVVDLLLEARYTVAKPELDHWVGGKKIDGIVAVTAGVSFKLGPKGGFKRPEQPIPANYTPYERRISELEQQQAADRSRIDQLNRELEAAKKRPAPQPVVESVPATMTVFFTIGSATISPENQVNLQNIANYMKKSPAKSFQVTGYADSSTGSAKRNLQLSRQRADAVADALVKLGVDRNKLVVEGKGGTSAFGNPSLCRIVEVE